MEFNWVRLCANAVFYAPILVLIAALVILVRAGWTDCSRREDHWLRASELALILLGLAWVFLWPYAWPLHSQNVALEWRLIAWAQGIVVYHLAVAYWLQRLKEDAFSWIECSAIVASKAASGVAFVAACGLALYFVQVYS